MEELEEEFKSLKRRELQALCKKHGIPANLTNVEMARRLASILQNAEDSEKVVKLKGCLKRSGGSGSCDEAEGGRGVSKKVSFVLQEEIRDFSDGDGDSQRVSPEKRRSSRRRPLVASELKEVSEASKKEIDKPNVTRRRTRSCSLAAAKRSGGIGSCEEAEGGRGVLNKVSFVLQEEIRELSDGDSQRVPPEKMRSSRRRPLVASESKEVSEASKKEIDKPNVTRRRTRSCLLAAATVWSPVVEKALVREGLDPVHQNNELHLTEKLPQKDERRKRRDMEACREAPTTRLVRNRVVVVKGNEGLRGDTILTRNRARRNGKNIDGKEEAVDSVSSRETLAAKKLDKYKTSGRKHHSKRQWHAVFTEGAFENLKSVVPSSEDSPVKRPKRSLVKASKTNLEGGAGTPSICDVEQTAYGEEKITEGAYKLGEPVRRSRCNSSKVSGAELEGSLLASLVSQVEILKNGPEKKGAKNGLQGDVADAMPDRVQLNRIACDEIRGNLCEVAKPSLRSGRNSAEINVLEHEGIVTRKPGKQKANSQRRKDNMDSTAPSFEDTAAYNEFAEQSSRVSKNEETLRRLQCNASMSDITELRLSVLVGEKSAIGQTNNESKSGKLLEAAKSLVAENGLQSPKKDQVLQETVLEGSNANSQSVDGVDRVEDYEQSKEPRRRLKCNVLEIALQTADDEMVKSIRPENRTRVMDLEEYCSVEGELVGKSNCVELQQHNLDSHHNNSQVDPEHCGTSADLPFVAESRMSEIGVINHLDMKENMKDLWGVQQNPKAVINDQCHADQFIRAGNSLSKTALQGDLECSSNNNIFSTGGSDSPKELTCEVSKTSTSELTEMSSQLETYICRAIDCSHVEVVTELDDTETVLPEENSGNQTVVHDVQHIGAECSELANMTDQDCTLYGTLPSEHTSVTLKTTGATISCNTRQEFSPQVSDEASPVINQKISSLPTSAIGSDESAPCSPSYMSNIKDETNQHLIPLSSCNSQNNEKFLRSEVRSLEEASPQALNSESACHELCGQKEQLRIESEPNSSQTCEAAQAEDKYKSRSSNLFDVPEIDFDITPDKCSEDLSEAEVGQYLPSGTHLLSLCLTSPVEDNKTVTLDKEDSILSVNHIRSGSSSKLPNLSYIKKKAENRELSSPKIVETRNAIEKGLLEIKDIPISSLVNSSCQDHGEFTSEVSYKSEIYTKAFGIHVNNEESPFSKAKDVFSEFSESHLGRPIDSIVDNFLKVETFDRDASEKKLHVDDHVVTSLQADNNKFEYHPEASEVAFQVARSEPSASSVMADMYETSFGAFPCEIDTRKIETMKNSGTFSGDEATQLKDKEIDSPILQDAHDSRKSSWVSNDSTALHTVINTGIECQVSSTLHSASRSMRSLGLFSGSLTNDFPNCGDAADNKEKLANCCSCSCGKRCQDVGYGKLSLNQMNISENEGETLTISSDVHDTEAADRLEKAPMDDQESQSFSFSLCTLFSDGSRSQWCKARSRESKEASACESANVLEFDYSGSSFSQTSLKDNDAVHSENGILSRLESPLTFQKAILGVQPISSYGLTGNSKVEFGGAAQLRDHAVDNSALDVSDNLVRGEDELTILSGKKENVSLMNKSASEYNLRDSLVSEKNCHSFTQKNYKENDTAHDEAAILSKLETPLAIQRTILKVQPGSSYGLIGIPKYESGAAIELRDHEVDNSSLDISNNIVRGKDDLTISGTKESCHLMNKFGRNSNIGELLVSEEICGLGCNETSAGNSDSKARIKSEERLGSNEEPADCKEVDEERTIISMQNENQILSSDHEVLKEIVVREVIEEKVEMISHEEVEDKQNTISVVGGSDETSGKSGSSECRMPPKASMGINRHTLPLFPYRHLRSVNAFVSRDLSYVAPGLRDVSSAECHSHDESRGTLVCKTSLLAETTFQHYSDSSSKLLICKMTEAALDATPLEAKEVSFTLRGSLDGLRESREKKLSHYADQVTFKKFENNALHGTKDYGMNSNEIIEANNEKAALLGQLATTNLIEERSRLMDACASEVQLNLGYSDGSEDTQVTTLNYNVDMQDNDDNMIASAAGECDNFEHGLDVEIENKENYLNVQKLHHNEQPQIGEQDWLEEISCRLLDFRISSSVKPDKLLLHSTPIRRWNRSGLVGKENTLVGIKDELYTSKLDKPVTKSSARRPLQSLQNNTCERK